MCGVRERNGSVIPAVCVRRRVLCSECQGRHGLVDFDVRGFEGLLVSSFVGYRNRARNVVAFGADNARTCRCTVYAREIVGGAPVERYVGLVPTVCVWRG